MKLIVGLGNPGRKYERTRHNVGYRVLAEVARQYAVGKPKAKFRGDVVEAVMDGVQALLLCPSTYMNLSGSSVGAAFDFYKLTGENLLLVCDDFHLPLGKLRFRSKGSSGGQKGLADVIRRLGTEEFARLRIGIGSPLPGRDPADFVLSKFTKQETTEIEEAIRRAAGAVTDWARTGIESCMNQYN